MIVGDESPHQRHSKGLVPEESHFGIGVKMEHKGGETPRGSHSQIVNEYLIGASMGIFFY